MLPGIYYQGPSARVTPIITNIDPPIVNQGSALTVTGEFLTPNFQFVDQNGIPTNFTGTVNQNLTSATVIIPHSLLPGVYNLNIVSSFGTGISPTVITIVDSQTPIGPSAQGISFPSAENFQELLSYVFKYAVIFVGIAVFIMILWAGFLWLTSAANPGNIARAKSMIQNAIIGATLLLSAYVILYTINPELVGGTLNLPGIVAP